MNQPGDAKERIRELTDIAEIIGEHVDLKNAGSGRLKGLCPFHSEKTPSFHVNREHGYYYCFGCEAKGDVFSFVMQLEGLEFVDALRKLGSRVGVEVTPSAPGSGRRRDLHQVNGLAQEYFLEHLDGPALQYLEGRGLTRETIDRFGLGFAPEGWDGLLRFAAARSVTPEQLLAAGLLVENERGNRYDRFRGRIMFPIRDRLGRTAGFAGRILGEGEPKYLNTPETDIFHKGGILFGLDLAAPHLRDSGEAVIVEGYMDVIALQQAGFGNAMATLGTALTAEHADLLTRQEVSRLYLAFDADEAGQRATLAGLDRSIGRSFLVKAVVLADGRDPADVVLEAGPDAFRTALERGMSEVDYRFRTTLEKHDATTDRGRQAILNELLPSLRPRGLIDPVAEELRRLVVDSLDVNEQALAALIGTRRSGRVNEVQARGLQPGTDRRTLLEYEIIALLLRDLPGLKHRLKRLEAGLPAVEHSELHGFLELARDNRDRPELILDAYRERPGAEIIFERLLEVGDEGNLHAELDLHIEKALSRLRELVLAASGAERRRDLEERLEEIGRVIAAGELSGEELARWYRELDELSALLAARDAERRLRSTRR
ncbi:MAG TPA: DNA primase [Deinococcales bacterium]|nr:DNA primase [Deinococcales bacterium]